MQEIQRCRFDPRDDPLEGHKESDRTEQLRVHTHTRRDSVPEMTSVLGLRFCGLGAGLHTGHSPARSFTCPSGWPPPPLAQPCISSMGPLSQLLSRLKRPSRLDSYVLIPQQLCGLWPITALSGLLSIQTQGLLPQILNYLILDNACAC